MRYKKCSLCGGRPNTINRYGNCCQRALRLETIRQQGRMQKCPVCLVEPKEPCLSKSGKARKSNHRERYERPFGAAQSQAPSLPT